MGSLLLPVRIIQEMDFLTGLWEMKASCISADHLQGQMNGAQYFTAVSSQRALRHVGISEADYAMQFIFLKPPIPLQTHTTCSDLTGESSKPSIYTIIRHEQHFKTPGGRCDKNIHIQFLTNRNVISKMSSWCLQNMCACNGRMASGFSPIGVFVILNNNLALSRTSNTDRCL